MEYLNKNDYLYYKYEKLKDYKIKYKIIKHYDLVNDTTYKLIIAYKKKWNLFYTERTEFLDRFAFAFLDSFKTANDSNEEKNLKVFEYIKNHPEENCLQKLCGYCVVRYIKEDEEKEVLNKRLKIPFKWRFYTRIKTDEFK